MPEKLKTLVIDRDLKGRLFEKFPVTKDGSKINIRSGGKGHFNPLFDNDSFVEFPRRSPIPPFRTVYDRVYIVRNGAKACYQFRQQPNELGSKIKTFDDLQELFTAAEEGNPEAQYQLNLVLIAIQDAGRADYLKPDPETVEEMARNEIAKGLGSEPEKPLHWATWVQLGLLIFILLKVLGVIT